MDAGIPQGATRQREYPDLGSGVRDRRAAFGLCDCRGMGSGHDEGSGGEEGCARKRNESRGGRSRKEGALN